MKVLILKTKNYWLVIPKKMMVWSGKKLFVCIWFEDKLKFEKCENYGFMFGDSRRMFFVPCYSEQNGYYSSDVDIYLDGNCVLSVDSELVIF